MKYLQTFLHHFFSSLCLVCLLESDFPKLHPPAARVGKERERTFDNIHKIFFTLECFGLKGCFSFAFLYGISFVNSPSANLKGDRKGELLTCNCFENAGSGRAIITLGLVILVI